MSPKTVLRRRHLLTGLAAASVLAGCSPSGSPIARPFAANTGSGARVAALLPLTGRNAALGQRMAKAIWLREDMGSLTGRTMVQDAGETAEQASAAARRALSEGANVLVGPLARGQTPAVVQVAGKTPVISLSNDRDLTASGAWVFGVTPRQSVDAVLRYARTSKTRRIAMINQDNVVTQRALGALRDGARKARVAEILPLPGATEPGRMADTLRNVAGGDMPDILYVPSSDAKAQVQAIAALREGVTTIGSLQWSGLSQEAFRRLDKACYTGPDPRQFDQASRLYQQQLDEDMGVIAALAVDAVALAHARGGNDRLDSREPVPGLLGPTRFLPDRTLQRELAVLRINNGGVERVA